VSFEASAAKEIWTNTRCVITQKNAFLRNVICLYKVV